MMHGLYSHIDAAITSIRRIAFELRPAALDGLDLEAAIKALASQFSSRSRIDVHCQIRAETAALSQSAATSIYRIVQEALTNTARHAQASRANVELYQFRDAYVLRIQDDDIGATRDKEAPPQSLGLRGMRERVRALNGSMASKLRPETATR
jgi:signal transduction histidine kinase